MDKTFAWMVGGPHGRKPSKTNSVGKGTGLRNLTNNASKILK